MAWNGSGKSPQTNPTAKRVPKAEQSKPGKKTWKPVVGGLFAVVAIVALVCVFMNRTEKHIEEPKVKETEKPKVEKTEKQKTDAKPRKPTIPSVEKPQETKPKKPKAEVLGKTPTGEEYVAVEASTNTTGVVESLYTLADGSKKKVVMLQSKDTLVFDNDFDNMLGLIGTTPLDQKLPPLPDLGDMEEQFKKAMKSPIIIREEDSEQAKKMKEAALNLRVEISDLMREGYTLTQILSEYESLRDRNVKERHAFQAELNEIYNSGDIEGARDYLKKANEKLEEFGIIPLTMPGEGSKRRRIQ